MKPTSLLPLLLATLTTGVLVASTPIISNSEGTNHGSIQNIHERSVAHNVDPLRNKVSTRENAVDQEGNRHGSIQSIHERSVAHNVDPLRNKVST